MSEEILYIDHLEDRYKTLDKSHIVATYVLILDQNQHMMLHYTSHKGWLPPNCHLSHKIQIDDRRLITSIARIDMDLEITITQLIGLGLVNVRSPRTEEATTYYLATINKTLVDKIDFRRCCAFTFSQLCLLPSSFHKRFATLLSVIYDPYKPQLILDLDCTLLISYEYETNPEKMNSINRDHYLIRTNCFPDYICPSGRLVWTRPHLHYFMENVSQLCDVSYWTSAPREIQMEVISEVGLDKYSDQYYFGSSCTKSPNGDTYKSIGDLNRLASRTIFDHERTIMIDDVNLNRIYNSENCIQIKPWNIASATTSKHVDQYRNDDELLKMLRWIQFLTDRVIHHKECIPSYFKSTSITERDEDKDKHSILLPHMAET